MKRTHLSRLRTGLRKTVCKLPNDRKVRELEKESRINDGQARFQRNKSCVDDVYTSRRIIQARKRARLKMHCFFPDVQKTYGTLWRKELWKQAIKIQDK